LNHFFNNTKTEKDQYTKKDKTVGELISEQRVIVFRDDEFAIDCKSHFPDIVESCEFSSNAFITAITDADIKMKCLMECIML
jgi:hypothetical protein